MLGEFNCHGGKVAQGESYAASNYDFWTLAATIIINATTSIVKGAGVSGVHH